jgi:hypothetical protein
MKSLNQSIRLKKSLILLIVLLAAFGCKKSNTPAPSPKASQVAFGIKAINPTTVLAASTSNLTVNSLNTNAVAAPIIQFTAGIANIAKFKLEAQSASTQVEIETRNLMNVDLFAATPSVINTTLDTGTYKQIEVSVVLTQSADTAAIPLKLKGTFTAADGSIVPIEFDINQNLTIKAEAKNVSLHNTGDLSTIVSLHLDKIVAGITASDLNSATKTGSVVVISNTSNVTLFNKIAFNVENCGDTQVEDDHHNGDGENGSNGPNHN